ncbi:MAG: glycosyltransferase 87 family protein [Pseudonocardia sp.]
MTAPSSSTATAGPLVAAGGWLMSPRRVLPVTLPLLALVVTWVLSRTRGYHIDLEVYRLGVQAWLSGGDMYGSLPPTVSGLALPFIYPPFAAMVLTPLVLLPWTASWIALFALSVASLAVTLYVVVRSVWRAGGRGGALAVGSAALPLAVLVEPVFETVKFGQVNLVLMALVAVDCLVETPRWPRGLLVGIAAAIKLTPAAFVLFFLLRRDLRATAVTVGTAVAATAIGFAIDTEASMRYWFDRPASGVSGSVFYTNESVQGVLARAGLDGLELTIAWLVATVGLLLIAVPVVRRAGPVLALTTVAGFALLVSPTSWSHHWVWIVPAVLGTGACAVRLRSAGWTAVTALLVTAFFAAPFQFLERGGERSWSATEQLVGATYVIVTAVLLVTAWHHYRSPA